MIIRELIDPDVFPRNAIKAKMEVELAKMIEQRLMSYLTSIENGETEPVGPFSAEFVSDILSLLQAIPELEGTTLRLLERDTYEFEHEYTSEGGMTQALSRNYYRAWISKLAFLMSKSELRDNQVEE